MPGVGGNVPSGDGTVLDPNFKPNHSDQFDFTIQRALSQKLLLESGYIGRRIRNEYQGVELNAVPTMYTVNGEQFANAYANTYWALADGQQPAVQPFFEGALGGASSPFCRAYSSCTAAVAAKFKSNILSNQVFNLWNGMATNKASASSWTLGRTLLSDYPDQLTNVFMVTSMGYSNYNALFFTFTARDWHGLTATSNFTWSRSLGTGDVVQATSELSVPNPFNISQSYGPQPFDYRFVYNLNMLYQIPYMRSQKGVVGRILGGWSIAPLFTAQSGAPLEVNIGVGSNEDCQSFGEEFCNGSASSFENAVPITPYASGNSVHNNVLYFNGVGSSGNPAKGGSGLNMFADPAAVFADFRPMILGYDTNSNGSGVLRGFPTWNLDLAVNKDFAVTERLGATFVAQFSNVFNHFQASSATTNFLDISSPSTWGVVTTQANTPRQIEFRLRIHF